MEILIFLSFRESYSHSTPNLISLSLAKYGKLSNLAQPRLNPVESDHCFHDLRGSEASYQNEVLKVYPRSNPPDHNDDYPRNA